MDEIKTAIKQTSSGKAAGMDGIPSELYKAAGPQTLAALHDVFLSIWDEEVVPHDFRDLQLSPFSKIRVTGLNVETIEEFPSYP